MMANGFLWLCPICVLSNNSSVPLSSMRDTSVICQEQQFTDDRDDGLSTSPKFQEQDICVGRSHLDALPFGVMQVTYCQSQVGSGS